VCEKMDIRGDLNNLGILHVLDKLYMRGRSLKNGVSNDQKGTIETEKFLFRGDNGSKLDNRYGSIKARKTLECEVEEIICGDCIPCPGRKNFNATIQEDRTLIEERKRIEEHLLMKDLLGTLNGPLLEQLGKVEEKKPYKHWGTCITKNGYGEYYVGNGSLISSSGNLTLKASKKLFLNYGNLKSRGKMTLESPHIELLGASIEGKDDIQVNAIHLFLKRKEPGNVPISSLDRRLNNPIYLHGEYRTSLASCIHSEGNIRLEDLKKIELTGSSIKAKKDFYLENKPVNLQQDKGVFTLLPYEGFYSLKCKGVNMHDPDNVSLMYSYMTGYTSNKINIREKDYEKLCAEKRKKITTVFSDPSETKCDGSLVITDKDLDLNFDHGVLEANRIKIQSSSLQSNNSVFINQENPSNGSRNIGEEYIEVKIEEEKKENTKRKLRSDRPDIQGAHKDIPIKVEDSGMEDSEMQQEPLEQMKKKIKTDDKNN
jgi:hypothetical protein